MKKKDLLLLANKLIKKVPASRNAKEHYQSFIKKKIRKSVKQSEIIINQKLFKPQTLLINVKINYYRTSKNLTKIIQDYKASWKSGYYMIPLCRDKISTRQVGTDSTLRLNVEIKFRPSKAGQFFTWHLFRFVSIFFDFSL